MTKGDKTKQFIIEQSAPIFNTKGIAATSMLDIMEATQLSKGSLYVHFESKEELVKAAVDYNLKTLRTGVLQTLSRYRNPAEKLKAFFDVFKDPLKLPVVGGCPMLNFGMEADDTDPVIREKIFQMTKISQEIIKEIIEEGIQQGVFKADWDYKEFATVSFALIEGGIMICRIAGNPSKMKIILKFIGKIISANRC